MTEKQSAPVEGDEKDGAEAVKAAASGKKLSNQETQNALDWFLSDEDETFTQELSLNVGSHTDPKWVTWEIQPVDLDTLRRIRQQAQAAANRQARRSGQLGEIDEVEANIRIVIEGTASPDIVAISQQKGDVDPANTLKRRFSHKPGLLGQIAGEIMSISGYDDEDVREVEAAKN